MTGKAFVVRQYRDITSWNMLKGLLEDAFCHKRTAGYLELELTLCEMRVKEKNVQSYSLRITTLVHYLLKLLTVAIKLKNNHARHNIPQCTSGVTNLLINTEVDLNLIKLNSLQDDVLISDFKIYKMQGISIQLVSTLENTKLMVTIRP